MEQRTVRRVDDAIAVLDDLQAQIDIVEVDGEVFVETADLRHDAFAGCETGAGNGGVVADDVGKTVIADEIARV